MSSEDEEHTASRSPNTYRYRVMPFGLKNVGETYQCALEKIFDDIAHKKSEYYVDDLVVKSKSSIKSTHNRRSTMKIPS